MRVVRCFALLCLAAVPAAAAVACGDVGGAAAPETPSPTGEAGPEDGGAEACTQDPVPDAGFVHVSGGTLGRDDAGIPGALIVAEYGGIYVPYCDLRYASPYYSFGAVTDDAGRWEMDVKAGFLGFHGFQNGYFYARGSATTDQLLDAGGQYAIPFKALPDGQAVPTIADAMFDPSGKVRPGTKVTFSAMVKTYAPGDPLSDEVVLVEPTHSMGVELDPPSIGKKDDFPDGTWKRTFAAPDKAGDYTYWVAVTTGGCVTSALTSVALTVAEE